MYSIDDLGTGEHFCLMAQRALKSKKILRIKHKYVWGRLVKDLLRRDLTPEDFIAQTDAIDLVIDYLEPCCFFHALADLEEEFIKINKQKYKQEIETRTYYVQRIEKVTEDNKIIELELFCET
mgnify:FL=1|tara:strand:- start:70 stop:438 length:369 start_codon:yes stop_codon:yes gene_type:complete